MGILDAVGIIGEMLSWVGVIIGLPALIVAVLIAAVDGECMPTKVTVVEDLDGRKIAMWSVNERTYTRPVSPHENLREHDSAAVTGYFPARRPERLYLHKRSNAERVCRVVGITMLSVAAVGFLLSLVPTFW